MYLFHLRLRKVIKKLFLLAQLCSTGPAQIYPETILEVCYLNLPEWLSNLASEIAIHALICCQLHSTVNTPDYLFTVSNSKRIKHG